MKAIMQKDLRENLKVALIGLLIFSLLLLQAYQSCIHALDNLLERNASVMANNLQPLLTTSLLIEAAFFCALFGAALGWLQTRNEAHRDLWAFLVHRPVTRSAIFRGKALAGLCLYCFGAGLPVAILIAVVRTPGHVAAPFEWSMVCPLILIFLTGGAYYFAGLLTGLRQARWYASRNFGLGLAIIASLGVFGFPEYWQSLGCIAVMVLVLGASAWGAYQTGGYYEGLPATGKLALILALTAGCGVALFVCVGLTVSLVLEPLTRHDETYRYYQMTRDGMLYQETMRNGELVSITDLDGHPLLDPKTGRPMEQKEFSKQLAYGDMVTTRFKDRHQNRNPLQNSSRYFSLCNITDKNLWYLDHHGKLIGYNGRTRKLIGSLEPSGPDGAAASEPFLNQPVYGYYYNSYEDDSRKLMATARTVYEVDFKARTMHPVFTLTNNDEIGGYQSIGDYVNESASRPMFFFTTCKTVQLLTFDGHRIFALPYQPGYFGYPSVQISFLPPAPHATNEATTRFAVWFQPDYRLNAKAGWKMPVHIDWLGTNQTIARSADVPALRPNNGTSWPDKLAPALLPPVVHVEFNKKFYSPWNLFSVALAGLSAVIGWILVRRHHFSTRASVGWTLFVFLLGIPGLLTLLCVQEWPVRETCPHCHQPRVVDRETCEHCDAAFAPPEKNGTEIFAVLEKA